jgi:hypothetical protein
MAESYLTEDEQELLAAVENYIEKHDQFPTLSKVSKHGPFSSTRNILLLEDLVEHKVLKEELTRRDGKEANIYSPAEIS